MPGYLVAGKCLADQSVANELWASLNFPRFNHTTSYMLVYSVSSVGTSSGSVVSSCFGTCAGVPTPSFSVPIVLRSCDPLAYPNSIFEMSVVDGSAVALAVAGVWLSAYAFRAVRRVLSSTGEADA